MACKPPIHAIAHRVGSYKIKTTMKIISAQEHQAVASPALVALANDADPRTLDLNGITRIDLQFPKFTDGRA